MLSGSNRSYREVIKLLSPSLQAPNYSKRGRSPMRVVEPLELGIELILLVALVTLTPCLAAGSAQARSTVESGLNGATQQVSPAAPPIPAAGLLAQPKSSRQVGVPESAIRAAIPPDNPQTPEKIALGQKLFFDGRLSADGSVACSTCHDPARAFTDGRPTSIGIMGRIGQRNAPTILNALYNKAQFWDGRSTTLEQQAALPIVNSVEMGQPSMDSAVARMGEIPDYDRRFRSIFGRPPNGPDLTSAIASYERTLVSFDSPFDHFIAGDQNAINGSAKRG